MRTAFLVIVVALLLPACATRPIPNREAVNAPAERILESKLLVASPNSGKVTVKRDSGFGGSACTARVFIDAKPVADLRAAEKIEIFLPAGEHIFSAWPNGICGGGMSEVRAMVKSGAEISFRIGYGSNGDFTINATAF